MGLLYGIAILNILDGGFTSLGLYAGVIEEQNPLMKALWTTHPLYFAGVKLGLSLLLILIGHRMTKAILKKWRLLYLSVLLLYSSVLGMHLFWIHHFI
ncbi:hypothetical protein GCM10008986_33430 [Salinibacillus aidingensis]|uniref:DUF5658 domain-containing protein n=1 Tax=Salinibacillus aidingensis TaxID=237684 RepID=A0ABN1BQS8_9BACI